MTENEAKAVRYIENIKNHATVTLDHIAKEEPNVSPLVYKGREEKANTILVMVEELKQYRAIGTHEECQTAMELYKEMYKRKFTLEAVEEYMKFEDECVRKNFTFKSLLEAREKQTPKKPQFNGGNWYRCHNGCVVHKKELERDFYCPKCGQAIDWSVGNEDTD